MESFYMLAVRRLGTEEYDLVAPPALPALPQCCGGGLVASHIVEELRGLRREVKEKEEAAWDQLAELLAWKRRLEEKGPRKVTFQKRIV